MVVFVLYFEYNKHNCFYFSNFLNQGWRDALLPNRINICYWRYWHTANGKVPYHALNRDLRGRLYAVEHHLVLDSGLGFCCCCYYLRGTAWVSCLRISRSPPSPCCCFRGGVRWWPPVSPSRVGTCPWRKGAAWRVSRRWVWRRALWWGGSVDGTGTWREDFRAPRIQARNLKWHKKWMVV